MHNYRFYLPARVWCFESSEWDFSLQWFTDRVPQFALKDENSWGGASISGASNGGATFFLSERFEANL
jgi:spore coat protein CotH